jgi:hypothetical protein
MSEGIVVVMAPWAVKAFDNAFRQVDNSSESLRAINYETMHAVEWSFWTVRADCLVRSRRQPGRISAGRWVPDQTLVSNTYPPRTKVDHLNLGKMEAKPDAKDRSPWCTPSRKRLIKVVKRITEIGQCLDDLFSNPMMYCS